MKCRCNNPEGSCELEAVAIVYDSKYLCMRLLDKINIISFRKILKRFNKTRLNIFWIPAHDTVLGHVFLMRCKLRVLRVKRDSDFKVKNLMVVFIFYFTFF